MSLGATKFIQQVTTFYKKVRISQQRQNTTSLLIHILAFLCICGVIIYIGYFSKALNALISLFTTGFDPSLTIVETIHLYIPILLTIILLVACGALVASACIVLYQRFTGKEVTTTEKKAKRKRKPKAIAK